MASWHPWWASATLAAAVGCAGTPPWPFYTKATLPDPTAPVVEPGITPVYIPQGAFNYASVFENVLSVLDNYGFDIVESNRSDGRIETAPRIAPGLGQFLKPGTPGFYDRAVFSLQTYRHRVSVLIQPAEGGGWFIDMQAHKELEDLPQPTKSTVGAAIFRSDNNVDRTFEVINPAFLDPMWLPKGRDVKLEAELLRRIRECM